MLIEKPKVIDLQQIKTSENLVMRRGFFDGYYFLITGSSIFVFKYKKALDYKIKGEDIPCFAELPINGDVDGESGFFSFFFDEKDSVFFLKVLEGKMYLYKTGENIFVHKKLSEK